MLIFPYTSIHLPSARRPAGRWVRAAARSLAAGGLVLAWGAFWLAVFAVPALLLVLASAALR